MQFKHPEILYFLFLLIPLLVHLFQFRRFKKYFTNVRFLAALSVQTRKSSKIKNGCYLAADYCYPYYHRFCATLFCSKDKENATNEMYILDNSSMQAKGKQGELLKRAVQELLEETLKTLLFLY
jgi:hypothetical protein